MKKPTFTATKLDAVIVGLFVGIITYLPFHALLSTWLWTNIGYEVWFKAGKEIVLTLAMALLLVRLWQIPHAVKVLLSRTANRLILGFAALHLILAASFRPELDALAAGLVINGRFFAMFILAQYLMLMFEPAFREKLVRVVLGEAYAVVAIGLLQAFILPADAMKFFGYGPDSIPAQFSIDSNDNLQRVASTLRGPNPFGAYLILPILLVASRLWGNWRPQHIGAVSLLVAGLVLSYSRSALLGLLASLCVFAFLLVPKRYLKKTLIGFGVVGVLLVLLSPLAINNSPLLQRVILHDDTGVDYATSTQVHFERQLEAIDRAVEAPLGSGPGTAGPASFYLDEGGIISENFYLQLSLEVGWLGLVIFLMIVFYVGRDLWRQRSDLVVQALFLSLVGLSVANLFLHVWADETTAMIWWGLAGLWFKGQQTNALSRTATKLAN